jgi:hypothetical protein
VGLVIVKASRFSFDDLHAREMICMLEHTIRKQKHVDDHTQGGNDLINQELFRRFEDSPHKCITNSA